MNKISIKQGMLNLLYTVFYYSIFFKKTYDSIIWFTSMIKHKINKKKLFCNLPWRSLVINCDGTISCSCADPFKLRIIGNIKNNTIKNIWDGKRYKTIRKQLLQNKPSFCYGCWFLSERNKMEKLDIGKGPREIWIEPSIICNLSCLNACCSSNTPIRSTRIKKLMDLDMFKRIIDELKDSLEKVNLFNYGEAFINQNIFKMIKYAKTKMPNVKIFISTNGLLIDTDEKRKWLIDSGIDILMFSVDGASQKTYSIYRKKGDFNKAYNNMKKVIEIRNQNNKKTPKIIWRYILFRWNDSDKEMNKALKLAEEAGVDKFYWEITNHPLGASSKRFYMGSREFEKIKQKVW